MVTPDPERQKSDPISHEEMVNPVADSSSKENKEIATNALDAPGGASAKTAEGSDSGQERVSMPPETAQVGEGAAVEETSQPSQLLIEPCVVGTDASSTKELNEAILADSRRHTRRAFIVAGAAAAAGYGLFHWLEHLPKDGMQQDGYRKAFLANAVISRTVFGDQGLAPTYPLSKSENLRVNGVYGLKKMLDPVSYRLQLVGSGASSSHPRYSRDVTAWNYIYFDAKTMEDQGHDTKTPPPFARTSEKMPPASMVEQEKLRENRTGRMPRGKEEAGESRSTLPADTPGLLLTMADILQLPRHELVTQFKCIEGWSQIVHWAGVRMADFMEAYPPQLIEGREPKYVYMETPDGDYYTGYDLNACRHPQTLLVTEMMGAPLTQYHGAPLRLHMPIKYGYKQIKRIGLIHYTNNRPDDYWTKLGYDWYAGL